jgi:hypothetical protein
MVGACKVAADSMDASDPKGGANVASLGSVGA